LSLEIAKVHERCEALSCTFAILAQMVCDTIRASVAQAIYLKSSISRRVLQVRRRQAMREFSVINPTDIKDACVWLKTSPI
jgi:hypothetical protein